MSVEFREFCDDFGPASSGFGFESSKSVLQLFVDNEDLEAAILELLGGVEPNGDGSLKRVLPKAHGRFSNQYCSNLPTIAGRLAAGNEDSGPYLEAEPLDTYGTWEQYLITAEFTPRPYDVLSDASIEIEAVPWIDEADMQHSLAAPNEWDRFTDYSLDGGAEAIRMQQGAMQFFTGSTTSPNGIAFSGFPSMIVPGVSFEYTWYMVPWSYIDSDNSYILGYQGYINQIEWDGFEPGSLLYIKPKVKRYNPPMPTQVQNPNGVGFSRAKVCDITFQFLYTSRKVIDPPTVLYNRNWIAAGHNCPPWLAGDRTFRYAAASGMRPPVGGVAQPPDPAKQVPTYLSIPFQLLFTDPDVQQAY